MATATEPITINVTGVPAPGGSKKAFVRNGHAHLVDDAKRNAGWKELVAFTARQQYQGPPLDGPLRVAVVFLLSRPRGHYGKGRNAATLKPSAPDYPTVKPDATKLWRSTEDALSGVLWRDDALIVRQVVEKMYTAEQPGAVIVVETLEPAEGSVGDGERSEQGNGEEDCKRRRYG